MFSVASVSFLSSESSSTAVTPFSSLCCTEGGGVGGKDDGGVGGLLRLFYKDQTIGIKKKFASMKTQRVLTNKTKNHWVLAARSYLGKKLRIIIRDVVKHSIPKATLQLGLAIGWAAAKRGKQIQAGRDGGLHQGEEGETLDVERKAPQESKSHHKRNFFVVKHFVCYDIVLLWKVLYK